MEHLRGKSKEGTVIDIAIRASKIWMVEKVEDVTPKLQLYAITEVESACNRQVELRETKASERVSSYVPLTGNLR